jgi:hypothetical protein
MTVSKTSVTCHIEPACRNAVFGLFLQRLIIAIMLSLLTIYVKNTKKGFVKVIFLYRCIKSPAASATIYPPLILPHSLGLFIFARES